MTENDVLCPFCKGVILEFFDDYKITGIDHEWGTCEHFFSSSDDMISWIGNDDEYKFINKMNIIIESYIYDNDYKNQLKPLVEGLKIKKYLPLDHNKEYELDKTILTASYDFSIKNKKIIKKENQIEIIEQEYGGRPSGIMYYVFIRDIMKIWWIFDELEVLFERLKDFDQNNKQYIFNK